MVNRLNALITFTILIAILLFCFSLYNNIKYEQNLLSNQISILNTSIRNEYKKRLKESVNQTIMFIDILYKNKLNLQINKHRLNKKNEENFLKELRYYIYNHTLDKTRYTWINKIINFKGGDNYAIRLIHPNLKKTEGVYLSTKAEDIKGNKPYLEELEGVKKAGEIYFTYYFKQLHSTYTTEKLSYAKLYKNLNWVVATGIPINTLNYMIKKEKKKIEESYNRHLRNIVIIRVTILSLFIILLLFLKNKLTYTLKENIELNKKLSKKLNYEKTKFNKFFELPINILLVANFDKKILEINSGWEKFLGYKEKDLQDISLLDLIHKNDLSLSLEEFGKLEKKEQTLYFENRIKHKDGKYKILSWSITSIPKKELFYAVAQDITELKEKSNLIYQQSKMAAIGEMTANIAHQWRQPLSIISTASSGIIVKKETDTLDDKFLIDTMNQITQSTQYLSQTIEDFRNFYTPNKEYNKFTIKTCMDKTLNLIKKRFESNNIKIITNIEEVELISFENELLQVLINILNNAREQLLEKEIEEKLIFINTYIKNKILIIDIIDNGLGIDEEIKDRIFEPYFTTKEKTIGTGIGLYMSEEIISKHLKGELLVENHSFTYKDNTYKGAKFTIRLDL